MVHCYASAVTGRGNPQKDVIDIALSQHGVVTIRDVEHEKIGAAVLRDMARRGVVRRVSTGVYELERYLIPSRLTQHMLAVLWPYPTRGTISHESALDLWDLCDVNPSRIDVTVPRAYRTSRHPLPLYRLHRRDLDPAEVTDTDGLPIVTPVRAVLDGIEGNVRSGLLHQAIESLRRRDELSPRDEERIFASLYARRRER